jgi:hypothetical protein
MQDCKVRSHKMMDVIGDLRSVVYRNDDNDEIDDD